MTPLTQQLRATLTGGLFLPGDERYEQERLSWHRTIDPHPAAVAEAAGPGDIRAAVAAAREHDVPIAVQATGHGTFTPADGGILLKTARMTGVKVDPERRTVRAAAGALWSDVLDAASPFGLAPVSGMTASVGVVGYTLGGGAGWLSRRYGFAADDVVAADVVTADGTLRSVGPEAHPDLFWALRGGGPSFGIVTSLELRLHPVEQVFAGMSLFPFDRARATLAAYRAFAAEEPDTLNTAVILLRMPDEPHVPEPMRGRPALAIRAFCLASEDEARRLLAPLLDAAGPPLLDGMRSMSYAQTSAINGAPAPAAVRQRFELARTVPEGLLDLLLETAGDPDSPIAGIELRNWGGAMSRPAEDAGPAGHRDVPFSILAGATIAKPAERNRVDAAMDALAECLRPFTTGGTFLNFLTDPTMTESAFTPDNHRRLTEVKRTWDPNEVFRLDHSIPPAAAAVAEGAGR